MNVEPQMFFSTSEPTQPKGIFLTESAVEHISHQLLMRSTDGYPGFKQEAQDKGIGIRFGVTGAGCGGYSYMVEFVDTDKGEDHVFEQDGIKIFVDKKSILLIDGMEVDFQTDGFSSGLAFNNPLAGQTCGCGESFTVN